MKKLIALLILNVLLISSTAFAATSTVERSKPITGGGNSGSYGTDSAKYSKWRSALARIRNSSGRATILQIGDSTTNGSGSGGSSGYGANARVYNGVVKLASILSSRGIASTAEGQLGFGAVSNWQTYDTRWVRDSDWANVSQVTPGVFGLSSSAWRNTTTTDTVVFTPVSNVDSFIVYYYQNSTAGTFSWAIDGGAATNVAIVTSSDSLGTLSIDAGAAGSHSLTIARVSGSPNILGVRAFNSEVPGVEIIQAGNSGARAGSFTSGDQPWSAYNILDDIDPDLILFCFGGINDWNAGTNLDTFVSETTAFLTVAKAAGDVVVVTGVPTDIAVTPLATQQLYVDALINIARSLDIDYIDLWRRLESYEVSQPLGLYADDRHPNGEGYADWASVIASRLINV